MASRASSVIFLSILAVASVAANPAKTQKLVLRAAFPANVVTSTPDYPTKATSYQVLAGYLYNFREKDVNKSIGFSDGKATVLWVTPKFSVFDIDYTYEIKGIGKLLVKGNVATDIEGNLLAITGGTGKFLTARGQVVDTVLKPSNYRFKSSVFEVKLEFTIVL